MGLSLPIHSIYQAIEGEGVRIGTPQVFIRLQGCSIGCLNCDSKETWAFHKDQHWAIEDIVQKVQIELSEGREKSLSQVSITGGDPMHPAFAKALVELCLLLKRKGIFVNIEASGQRVDSQLFEIIDFISFDVKTPSTGVRWNPRPLEVLLQQFGQKSQVKAVISDKKDYDFFYDIYDQLCKKFELTTPFVVTPAFNTDEALPKVRIQSICEYNLAMGAPFRVILQQHKVIYHSSFGDF